MTSSSSPKLRRLSTFIIGCVTLMSKIRTNNALNAYLYYEDAQCTGDNYISGTLIYDYEDDAKSVYDIKGFQVEEYDGPCHYFSGGFYDFTYAEPQNGRYTSTGYCLKCNGVIGCSPTTDSCHEFSSLEPSTSDDGGNDDDAYNDDGDDDYSNTYNSYAKSEANKARKIIKRNVKASNNSQRVSYLFIGAVSMLFMLSILSGSLAAVRKIRDSNMDFCKDRSQVLNNKSEGFEDDYQKMLDPSTTVI